MSKPAGLEQARARLHPYLHTRQPEIRRNDFRRVAGGSLGPSDGSSEPVLRAWQQAEKGGGPQVLSFPSPSLSPRPPDLNSVGFPLSPSRITDWDLAKARLRAAVDSPGSCFCEANLVRSRCQEDKNQKEQVSG